MWPNMKAWERDTPTKGWERGVAANRLEAQAAAAQNCSGFRQDPDGAPGACRDCGAGKALHRPPGAFDRLFSDEEEDSDDP